MKAHEEEWTADGNRLCRDHGRGPFSFARFDPHSDARARLAAQAPAMARLLLKLHARTIQADPDDGVFDIPDLDRVLRAAGVTP